MVAMIRKPQFSDVSRWTDLQILSRVGELVDLQRLAVSANATVMAQQCDRELFHLERECITRGIELEKFV